MFKSVLELSQKRRITSGSEEALIRSIKGGADLRIYTEFRHNEHIDTSSENRELIQEVSEFPATYIIEDQWCAGIMTLRQPAALPGTFGPRPSMSFFMYNMDGSQAIARPFLDGKGPEKGSPEASCDMRLFHDLGKNDYETCAPSSNFIYDFNRYSFFVNECYEEVYAIDASGERLFGSLNTLSDAAAEGAQIKVAIGGLCDCLCCGAAPRHEVFIQAGPMYYYTETKYLLVESHPLVRVRPQIPMRYLPQNWDFGWVIARTDGHVAGLWYNPYTLKTFRTYNQHPIRWFIKR